MRVILSTLALMVLLGSCAYRGPVEGTLIAPTVSNGGDQLVVAPVPSVLEEIYAEIDAAVVNYESALGLIDAGSSDLGRDELSNSQSQLDDLVNRCRAIAGCDLARALNAYQAVITLQSGWFEQVGVNEQDAETEVEPPSSDVYESPQPAVTVVPPGTRVLNGQDLESLIPNNRQLNEALNDWLTWRRPLLMSSYENYQYLRADMAPAFSRAGLPEALLFGIMAVESGGKVHAYSRAGAAGPLQFMRATGSRYGLNTSGEIDDRYDPNRAADAAVVYLNDQMRRLDNSLEKVLAAYNAGENRLARLNRRLKNKDFWSSDFYYALPRDTRSYVPDVLAAASLYLHPQRFGLQFPEYATAQSRLVLESDMSLGELAACFGNAEQSNGWFRTLRNLNPTIKASQRLDQGDALLVPTQLLDLYQRNCRDPEVLSRVAAMHDAAYGGLEDFVPYTVQNGDTMSQIARRYRCATLQEIAAINNIRPPRYSLRAGKSIKVPSC